MAVNPDLEATIAAAPDSFDPYLVYADWLQGQGDPRGELIMLQYAQHTATRPQQRHEFDQAVQAHLETHQDSLLGELGEVPGLRVSWFMGFIKDANFDWIADARGTSKATIAALNHRECGAQAVVRIRPWRLRRAVASPSTSGTLPDHAG